MMLDSINFLQFVLASWALIITPGPDILFVLSQGLSSGRKNAVLSAIGVTSGILIHTSFAALGLSIILKTSAFAFNIVKIVGSAYLIFLGMKAILSKKNSDIISYNQDKNYKSVFIKGLLSNVLNPKVALFFLAFLPQFISNKSENFGFQIIILGILFAFFALFFLLLIGYSAQKIGSLLLEKKYIGNKLRWVSGSILILIGLQLAFVKQN